MVKHRETTRGMPNHRLSQSNVHIFAKCQSY